jgi:ABC-type Na+ efflux pump permease subunit
MAEDQEKQKSIDFWKMFQIISPLVSVIAFIIYLQANVAKTEEDVKTLKSFNDNISKILTAHTTQIAVNSSQINSIIINTNRLEDTLIRVETKIDKLITNQHQH